MCPVGQLVDVASHYLVRRQWRHSVLKRISRESVPGFSHQKRTSPDRFGRRIVFFVGPPPGPPTRKKPNLEGICRPVWPVRSALDHRRSATWRSPLGFFTKSHRVSQAYRNSGEKWREIGEGRREKCGHQCHQARQRRTPASRTASAVGVGHGQGGGGFPRSPSHSTKEDGRGVAPRGNLDETSPDAKISP